MIVINENETNTNHKRLCYVNYQCTKTLLHNLYFRAKNITSFFQNSAGQVKIKLHTTVSNGF